jgi:hypothetical protein
LARTHEIHVGFVRALLRDLVEMLLVRLARFKVGDLDTDHIRRPAIAERVGALEQGFRIRRCRCGVADKHASEEETDQEKQQEYS